MATVPNPTPPADPSPPLPAPPAPADPIPPTPSAGSSPASTEVIAGEEPAPSQKEIKETEEEQHDGQRDQLRKRIDKSR